MELNSSFWVLAKLKPSITRSLIRGFSGFFVYTLQSIETSGLDDVANSLLFTIVYFSFFTSSDITTIFAFLYSTNRLEKLFKKYVLKILLYSFFDHHLNFFYVCLKYKIQCPRYLHSFLLF